MLPYYEKYKLTGILEIKAKELEKIRHKHPEAWQQIDKFMDNMIVLWL